MPTAKTNCKKCDAEITQRTSDFNKGLCMPCQKGRGQRSRPGEPIPVSCVVDSLAYPDPTFHTTAQVLLDELENTAHSGDDEHPNRYEMEAQRALLRHAISQCAVIQLHEDHWDKTKWALVELFEKGEAEIEQEGRRYSFSDIEKEKWAVHGNAKTQRGGIQYKNKEGENIFVAMTWMS